MKSERRFLTESGDEIFTGNELLLKGALETPGGVHLLGGYPGSPIAGFFDSLSVINRILRERGIRVVINNNEALAAAMLNGSQTLPLRSMIVIKSVGVHVAADALALGNLAGAHTKGGAIVVYGDDPWSDSTQVPADSRYISKHLFIPVIEPSNPQEVKDFVGLSFTLSSECELYAGYMLTNNLADGGGTVTCKPNYFPALNTACKVDLLTDNIDLDKRVLLPPKTWWQEESLAPRLAKAAATARQLGMNRIEYPRDGGPKSPLGFVAAGLGHDYLLHAMEELGVRGEFPVLKLGMSYPLDGALLEDLARQTERIVVVEERRGFMEEQAAAALVAAREHGRIDDCRLYGKEFPDGLAGIPATRGLDPSRLMLLLGPLIEKTAPGRYVSVPRETAAAEATGTVETDGIGMPIRLASFCPGCPHRDSAALCLEIKRKFMDPAYMKRRYGREPVDLVFHGDTGCYTMLMYPPNTPLMHDYSGMGLGGSTGAGTDPFITNKEVVFMGDSTFFHSGQVAIGQAITLNQDITFIILDNSTTAMTGHQPHPGNDFDIVGESTPAESIEDIVRGIGGELGVGISRINPEHKDDYHRLLEATFLADGVKVIIADKECGITRNRRRKREEREMTADRGFLPRREYMNINQDICRFCTACADIAGCPALRHVQTDYGRKMDTDPSWCVVDGACARVRACDAFERITVKRKTPPRNRVPDLDLDNIPAPRKRPAQDIWRCVLTGVGGMGIGVATSILVRAGHIEGYQVTFLDKKGLAIRNGGVVSQVVYNTADDHVHTGLIPYGKADLLLGVDILEAARTIDPRGRLRAVSRERTSAVVNTDKIATVAGLMEREDFDPAVLESFIRRHTREEDFLARNISRICEKYLDTKLYANVMMIGYAFQQGLIPVSPESIHEAINEAIQVDGEKNIYAFNMGRKLVDDRDLFRGPPARRGWRDLLEDKCRWVRRRHGKNTSRAPALETMVSDLVERTPGLSADLHEAVVVRAYDCLRWGGPAYARRYVDAVLSVYTRDDGDRDYAATAAVVYNLATAMLIKDSVFKAELATAPDKFFRDWEKYNINPASGDRIVYRYLWNIRFRVGSKSFSIRYRPRKWQLRILKRCRRLRPLLKLFGAAAPWEHRRRYLDAVAAFDYGSAAEYDRQVALLSGVPCMDCPSASCSVLGCPLDSGVPDWVSAAAEGDWQRAADLLHAYNNFPEFTALLCPAFCEDHCKRSAAGFPVQIRQAERDIIERAFAEGWVVPAPAAANTGRRAAVIGSGPAGLAAAQQLARAGHEVTVFERDAKPGGLLRYGIPGFRLEKSLIDRRLAQLTAEGIQFRCSSDVGGELPVADLRNEFDALCLATGARRPVKPDLPGIGAAVEALDYLLNDTDENGNTVVVIGGGLTGEDCIETALRRGAEKVCCIEILPRAAGGEIVGHEEDERVAVYRSTAAAAIETEHGKPVGLRLRKLRYLLAAGNLVSEEIPDGALNLSANRVVIAAGFRPHVPEAIAAALGIRLRPDGGPAISEDMSTTADGVFAAGDLANGASYIATAIDSGRTAAACIDGYLGRVK